MRFSFLLIFTLLVACNKSKNYQQTLLIGHGGNGFEIQNAFYHDNSAEAIDVAMNLQGTDGVELDLRLSAEGKPWFYHDEELANETNGSGCLESNTSAELENITYSTSKQEHLLSLQKLDFSAYKGKTLFFDVRHYDPCKSQAINKEQLLTELQEFKNSNPQIELKLNCKVAGIAEYFANAGFQVYIEVAKLSDYNNYSIALANVEGITIDNLNVEKDEITQFRKTYSKKVVIYGPRSPKFIRRALKKQPDYLMTDDLRTAIIEKY